MSNTPIEPAPWQYEKHRDGYRITHELDGVKTSLKVTIAEVYGDGNAMLLAAAPDMLAALKDFVESFNVWRNSDTPEDECGMAAACVKARDAITKATGVRQ